MKKLLSITAILLILLCAGFACAESIFGDLAEEETPPPSLTAPSYGAMANVEPDRTEPSADGGTIVTYLNVSASGVNEFGVYLGRLGFVVTKRDSVDDRLAFAVSDGRVSFVMIYDQAEKIMQLIYPKGTAYAGPLFPGYTRIAFNEEISIPGLGKFTFRDFVLDGKGTREAYTKDKTRYPAKTVYSWLSFHLLNTSSGPLYMNMFGDLLFDGVVLAYRSGDGAYTFTPDSRGDFSPPRRIVQGSRSVFPLGEGDFALSFDLPAHLRASSDGTIAVLLDFRTGEKYFLLVRENGVDLNLAPAAAAQ